MTNLGKIYTYCVLDGVPRRSLGVAVVVGTLLNLINQGDVLLTGWSHLDLTKILLTYAVPYCVASYGAVSFRLRVVEQGAPRPPAGNRLS